MPTFRSLAATQGSPNHTTSRGTWSAVLVSLVLLAAGCQTPPPTESAATSCSSEAQARGWHSPRVLSPGQRAEFSTIIDDISNYRVVLVGEDHQRLEHHLTQLEIICRLHQRDPNLAIGVEFVQRPFQAAADDFITGQTGIDGFLNGTEYFERWGYDFRLYEPLVNFAREHDLPIIALNAPAEVTRKVGESGIDSLSAEERAQIAAELSAPDDDYRARIEAVFAHHPQSSDDSIERFMTVQGIWDDTMAEAVANYLKANPQRTMVVIAGNGHVAHESAMPERIARRLRAPVVAIAQTTDGVSVRSDVDYVIENQPVELGKPGLLGVLLDVHGDKVTIIDFTENSAARDAGVQKGDAVVGLDEHRVSSFRDIKLVMWKKNVGDSARLKLERAQAIVELDVTLR